jgi:hypothetical protein
LILVWIEHVEVRYRGDVTVLSLMVEVVVVMWRAESVEAQRGLGGN